jgi:hypothetical protein
MNEEYTQTVLNDMAVKLAAYENIREWTRMMKEGVVNTKDIIRVEVNDNGTVNLLDFTLPSKSGMKRDDIPQEDVEPWIMESISMLRITEANSLVPELGFKVSDQLYYILNREGETFNERIEHVS